MTKIIAIETSTPRGSLAIWSDGALIWERAFLAERGASSELFTLLEQARDDCEGATQIAVGLGPGSFSGVRIAIAAAIGFGLALDVPLVGLSSYSALVANAPHYRVLGDARRGTFYFTQVRDGACVAGPELLLDAGAADARLHGSTLPIYSTEALADFPQATLTFPCASVLAQHAAAGRGILQRDALEPLYLRPPHITPPRAK